MDRQKAIELLEIAKGSIYEEDFKEALSMAIYDMGIVEELRKERDAALDTAFAALKMREEKKC